MNTSLSIVSQKKSGLVFHFLPQTPSHKRRREIVQDVMYESRVTEVFPYETISSS